MLEQLLIIMRQAGVIARAHFGRLQDEDIHYKGALDLVTTADHAIEDFLREQLARAFPGIAFWGEEGHSGSFEQHDRVFIVDPLDGTTGFVHGHPFHSISLGYRHDARMQIGVVYLPYFDEIFYAERGHGAFWDGKRIQVSGARELIESLGATGFACVRARAKPDNLPLFNDMIYRLRGVRRCGSAAADLCYVAAGMYEVFWEYCLEPYDVAAGCVIVEEAGGKVTDLTGGPDYLTAGHIVASNGRVHDEFVEVSSGYVPVRGRATGT